MVKVQRIAIIGGGASGLNICRHLAAEPDVFAPVVFEQTMAIGGTWVYTERTGTDDYGLPIHSSMYKSLRTNLPKELMAFLDYPFPKDGPSFPSHEEILDYLQQYCKHFQLLKYFRFCTKVVCVKPLPSTEPQLWSVEVENVKTNDRETQEFDKIVIANGHYYRTRYVDFPGLKTFAGTVMHSHSYRVPDSFCGLNVLCIGAGSSGIDISIELSTVANKVGLCHDLPDMLSSPFPKNLQQLPWPLSADAHGFCFNDGRYFRADAIIFCTGYEYSFEFLAPECGLSVVEHRVTPLYKHLIHSERPSMAILCIPFTVIPFVVSDVQSQLLVKVFKDPSGMLPTTDEMTADTYAEMMRRAAEGYKPRHFHKFARRIWEYLQDLVRVELADLKPILYTRERLHLLSFDDRLLNLCTFRDINYSIMGEKVMHR